MSSSEVSINRSANAMWNSVLRAIARIPTARHNEELRLCVKTKGVEEVSADRQLARGKTLSTCAALSPGNIAVAREVIDAGSRF
jgi:hypothetical protein